eukprot:TRINITY_DN14230_c0_g1_i1.p1 TRINITY_DN14230_c0_g1~~TRINITY_DN14230_c0_g1_i1.p1  ORF type:complete len:253 (+),score=11.42 TRINITY_DN14230_c0_g1_i1:24-761(+)
MTFAWVGLVWLILVVCANANAAQNTNCAGCVNGVCFNLTKLQAVVGGEVSCKDRFQNTYFYQVCGVSSQPCKVSSDPTPAVCQRVGVLTPPDWYDCGNANMFEWLPRPNNPDPKSGFLLAFTGGRQGRTVGIEFVCDTSATGGGTFEPNGAAENPVRTYHLRWTTEHACPIDHGDGDDDGDGDAKTLVIVIPTLVAAVCLCCSILCCFVWCVCGRQAPPTEERTLVLVQEVVPRQYVVHAITVRE